LPAGHYCVAYNAAVSRLYLVRHGRASAGWTQNADPDLDKLGHTQAAAVAAALSEVGPVPVLTSPLRRTRSTAAAFERLWDVGAVIDARVGEIPSPPGPDGALERRGAWLAEMMTSRWDDPSVGATLQAWRRQVVDALIGLEQDTVVTTHFVAINAAVGDATDDPRVTCFRPDNCSCTVLDVEQGRLTLVERGREATTEVR
jgi:broad specificity phosphatase PhoE